MSSSLDELLSAASSFSLVSAPSGSGDVAFASSGILDSSPLSVGGVLGSVGFLPEGTGAPTRCFPVVLIRPVDPSLCFGVVGSGSASFCVRKNCKIKAHVENKVGGILGSEDARYFISRIPDMTVFSEPNVGVNQVPVETRLEWETKIGTLPEWVRVFRAISIHADDEEEASNEDIKLETRLLVEAQLFKTPAKKRRAKTEVLDELEPLWSDINIGVHERSLPVDGAPELETVISSLAKGGLTRIVARLESSVVGLGTALEEVASLTHRRFGVNEENVLMISGAIQNLISVLGPAVDMGVKFEAPTLWGTAAFVGNEVERVNCEALELKSQIAVIKTAIQSSFADTKKDAEIKTVANAKMLKIITLVMDRVQAFTPEIEMIRKHVQKLETEFSATHLRSAKKQRQGVTGEGEADAMDDLMEMLTSNVSMKDDAGYIVTPTKGNISEGNTGDGRDLKDLKVDVTRMEANIRMIIGDVGLLKACAEDKSIKFGGLGLRTLQECHTWIDENFKGLRYGLVMDPLLMLDRIFGSDDVEAESQFKILESRVKLKITTGAEAAAIKALHFNRPRLFHKGRVAMTSERNTSKLLKLPTFKSWKSGGEGVRNYITKQMNLIHSTVTHDIAYAFGSDPSLAQAQNVATTSLNATITFLTQLLGFIDTIYEKLHLHSKFSADQAWSLTTQILDRVCEDLYAPKEGVAAAMTVEDPVSICSHLLWSCFRTHDVMAIYIEHNFENHPAISAEYVKFLATNSGYDKVEKMEVIVLAMKADVAKALDLADKAAKKGEMATDKFSAAHKEIEALKKRIQTLETKGNK